MKKILENQIFAKTSANGYTLHSSNADEADAVLAEVADERIALEMVRRWCFYDELHQLMERDT